MKIIILNIKLLLGISLFLSLELYEQDFERSVITDPAISRRCESMLEQRRRKIQNKQRLDALIVRNQTLQRAAPDNKVSVRKDLEQHLNRVQQERRLTLMQIQDIEETIVRQGCPGIQL
jgi:hypothetical protein